VLRGVLDELLGLAVLCALSLTGFMFFHTGPEVFVAALVVYLCWHLANLWRLNHWIKRGTFRAPRRCSTRSRPARSAIASASADC
jgi:hypothetical protein